MTAGDMMGRGGAGFAGLHRTLAQHRSASTLVTGAAGFIGGHLVRTLLEEGETVRAVDVKPLEEWHQSFPDADNRRLDLSLLEACREAVSEVGKVYSLAADMGGMGFIENNRALCMLSVLIDTHMLKAVHEAGAERFFYSSSACVYPIGMQQSPEVTPLAESDAYPAMPEDGYGWEKLFAERMCLHFLEDFGLETRVARYHNVYGPQGTFEGGREKAPAAICRKVAEAVLFEGEEIEIWGDGEQTRSFMWIDDCVTGTRLVAEGPRMEPINLGSSELVSINQLVDIVESIAGTKLTRRYASNAPQGVRGRNSDNALIEKTYGWEPSTPLAVGLEQTYRWIYDQLADREATADLRPSTVWAPRRP